MPSTDSAISLSIWRLAAYAAPALPLALVVFPAAAILPGFYAEYTSIPLTTIGTLLIVARVFDAVVDPVIGYLSDATCKYWGGRKPWLVAGTLILVIATPALYSPAPDRTALAYLGWMLVFYLGYSLVETPYKAWGTELSSDYRLRSKISASVAIGFSMGTLIFAVLPFITASGARTYDARTLNAVGMILVALLPAAVAGAVGFVSSGRPNRGIPTSAGALLCDAIRNRPLQWFLGVFALTGFGQGIFYGLVFLLLTVVMPFRSQFAVFLLVDAIATFAGLPLWYAAMTRWSKQHAWALGSSMQAIALLSMSLVVGTASTYVWMLVLIGLRAVGGAVIYVAPGALLGDVIDYELFRSRVNRAANYHALSSLLTKGTATAGGGLGLVAVGWMGFDPHLAPTPAVVGWFKSVSLLGPAFLLVGAAVLVWRFPLTRMRQQVITRVLARRRLDGKR